MSRVAERLRRVFFGHSAMARQPLGEMAYWVSTVVLGVLLCVVCFRQLLPNMDTQIIGLHNDAVYSFNVLDWQWRSFRELTPGRLLDAPIMEPLPHGHAYGDNLTALALLGFPLAALGHDVLAYNVLVLLTFVLCLVCGTGFCRALTHSRWAGWVGGVTFAFLPIRLTTLYHPNNLATMWCALAAWAVVRWHETRRWYWVFIFGASLHLQFLSSIQLMIHLAMLSAIWLLVSWARHRFAWSGSAFRQGCALVLGTLLLLAPWATIYAQTRTYLSQTRSTEEMFMYRPPLSDWVGRLSPGGLVVVLLIVTLLLGALRAVRPAVRRAPWAAVPGAEHLPAFFLCCGAAVILSQGPFVLREGTVFRLPYYWLMQVVPLLKTIRAPQRIQRVAMVMASGGAAVGLTWLMLLARNITRRMTGPAPPGRSGPWSRLVPRAIAVIALVVAIVRIDPPSERTRPLETPALGRALASVPANAVVFPLPLALNWPQRPPLDYYACQRQIRMVGGYGGAIPDLFWYLRRHTDLFPNESALEAIRATGATHLLVNIRGLSASQRQAFGAWADQQRRVPLTRAPPWQLWALGTPSPRIFEPLVQPATRFSLDGPATVAPGQMVTFSLAPHLDQTFVDGVQRRSVDIEINGPDGDDTAVAQQATLLTPFVVEPEGFPYQLTFRAPSTPGGYELRIQWANSPLPPPPLRWRFAVTSGLQTSFARAVQHVSLEIIDPPPSAFAGGRVRLSLRVRNDDDFVWLARSNHDLPANKGAIIAHVTMQGPRPLHKVYPPWHAHVFLPRDLAPGESVDTIQYFEAPSQPGPYRMTIKLTAHQIRSPNSAAVRLPGIVRVD